MTDPFSNEDLAFLDAAFAASVDPVPPPAATRAQILAAVRDIPHDGLTLRAEEGQWVPFRGPGVEAKTLCTDPGRNTITVLVRMQPGARLDGHLHNGNEECYVVDGAVSLGGVHIAAGDFHRAPAGTRHGEVRTQVGCTLLIVVDQADVA